MDITSFLGHAVQHLGSYVGCRDALQEERTPHTYCVQQDLPQPEKTSPGWSGQGRLPGGGGRDGKGKRTNVPGLRRGAEVEGGGPTGELSQAPVGVQDVSLCSVLPALTSLIGCRGWGCLARAAFRPYCHLSLPSQDASGAGPGESGTWAFSAVVLVGGHPGSLGLATVAAGFAPRSQLRAPRVCAPSGPISLPPPCHLPWEPS